MESSTSEQPLLGSAATHAAVGHNFDGSPIEDGWRVYPEMAPAGLWSTPSDLARFLIGVYQARVGELPDVLSVDRRVRRAGFENGDFFRGRKLVDPHPKRWTSSTAKSPCQVF